MKTFLDIGDKVKLENWWLKGDKQKAEKAKLVGVITGYDERSREGIYYQVKWNIENLEKESIQGDALQKSR